MLLPILPGTHGSGVGVKKPSKASQIEVQYSWELANVWTGLPQPVCTGAGLADPEGMVLVGSSLPSG